MNIILDGLVPPKDSPETGKRRRCWPSLTERSGLTVHDAAYLELANRYLLPLASLEQGLCDAATAMGIELLGA